MKKLHLLGFIIITILFASCGTEKKVASQQQQQQQTIQQPTQVQQPTQQQFEQSLPETPPCGAYYDDGKYIRVVGMATMSSQASAHTFALEKTRKELNKRVLDIIKTMSNCSLYDIDFKDLTKQLSNHAPTPGGQVVCKMRDINENGSYTYYVAMQSSKETIKLILIAELNRISKEQNLGIDFSEEKFVNYMNTIMDIK